MKEGLGWGEVTKTRTCRINNDYLFSCSQLPSSNIANMLNFVAELMCFWNPSRLIIGFDNDANMLLPLSRLVYSNESIIDLQLHKPGHACVLTRQLKSRSVYLLIDIYAHIGGDSPIDGDLDWHCPVQGVVNATHFL